MDRRHICVCVPHLKTATKHVCMVTAAGFAAASVGPGRASELVGTPAMDALSGVVDHAESIAPVITEKGLFAAAASVPATAIVGLRTIGARRRSA
jgi:hypothetical protein